MCFKFCKWKTFSKNYKSIKHWLYLVYKFNKNNCRLRLSSEFVQTEKRYPASLDKISVFNLKTTSDIKPKSFLWAKLPKNLLLVKYLISAAAALSSTHSLPQIKKYRCVKKMIHQIDKKSRVVPFSKLYGNIWVGFYFNTGKLFFLEVSF